MISKNVQNGCVKILTDKNSDGPVDVVIDKVLGVSTRSNQIEDFLKEPVD
jgi:hypothetical protein